MRGCRYGAGDTIRISAIRTLAYAATGNGRLAPELAAGIKGASCGELTKSLDPDAATDHGRRAPKRAGVTARRGAGRGIRPFSSWSPPACRKLIAATETGIRGRVRADGLAARSHQQPVNTMKKSAPSQCGFQAVRIPGGAESSRY